MPSRSSEGPRRRPGVSTVELKFGAQALEYTIAAAETSQTRKVAVDVGGETVASRSRDASNRGARSPSISCPTRTMTSATRRSRPTSKRSRSTTCWKGSPPPAARPTIPKVRAICLECRGAVGRGPLPASLVVKATRGIRRRRPTRPGRPQRDVPERTDRTLPAGGVGASLPLRDRVGPAVRHAGGLGND